MTPFFSGSFWVILNYQLLNFHGNKLMANFTVLEPCEVKLIFLSLPAIFLVKVIYSFWFGFIFIEALILFPLIPSTVVRIPSFIFISPFLIQFIFIFRVLPAFTFIFAFVLMLLLPLLVFLSVSILPFVFSSFIFIVISSVFIL